MKRLSRRHLLVIAGALTGVAATSRLLGSQSNELSSSSFAARLGPSNRLIGQDLIELGQTVNSKSSECASLVMRLVDREPDTPIGVVIVGESRNGSSFEIVAVEGWQLPELIAGVAGVLAANAT
jgi:hypothetical protein